MNEFVRESLASLDSQLDIIETCLGRINEDQVWYKADDALNSIGNLCLHLAGSEYAFISSIIGGRPFIRQRSKEFTDFRTMNVSQLLVNLKSVRAKSKDILTKIGPEELNRQVEIPKSTSSTAPGQTRSCLSVILYVVEHYAYHTGQIVYMTKILQEGTEHVLKWRH